MSPVPHFRISIFQNLHQCCLLIFGMLPTTIRLATWLQLPFFPLFPLSLSVISLTLWFAFGGSCLLLCSLFEAAISYSLCGDTNSRGSSIWPRHIRAALPLSLALTLPLLWAGSRRENSLQVRFTLNQNTPAVRFASPIAHLAMILVIVDSDFVVSELGLVRDWFSCYTSIYYISNCLR